MYPQYPGYPVPPPAPRRTGLSPLAIVLVVVSVVAVLGGGACVVGLVLLGASAEPDEPVATNTPAVTATATGTAAAATTDPPAEVDPPAATPAPTVNAASPGGGNAVTPIWFCNATGMVRVCGFAGVCGMQNVFGVGSGPDRFIAQNSAKMACEGMARAKGASTVCAVSCSVATKK